MAHLRIAVVTHHHHELGVAKDGKQSLGDMIDKHVAELFSAGQLVQGVELDFGIEEQMMLSEFYNGSTSAAVADDGASNRKSTKKAW